MLKSLFSTSIKSIPLEKSKLKIKKRRTDISIARIDQIQVPENSIPQDLSENVEYVTMFDYVTMPTRHEDKLMKKNR